MFKRLLALVLLGFLAMPAMGQSTQLGASDLLPNMLSGYNPGFENGVQRWTKAGSSTFTQTTTAANVAFGNGAASWTPGANNDTLTSTQVTVPSGLFGRMCMGAAWIKASDAVTTFQVINGSSTVQASTVLSSQSTYTRYQVAFTCPSSGTLAVQLKASGAGSAVLIDQVYLGATTEMPVVDFNETTTPSNPIAGKLRVYGKSDNNLYFLNSSGTEQQVGSGSGQKNYIQTSSNTAAGWTASSSNITVTTDTTVADLPRPQTTKSAVVFTGVSSNTDYGFVNFTLDPSDYNVKQQVSFAQACGLSGAASAIANCAASNFKVDVYSCTVAWSGSPATTCSGTSTRLPLSTDSSSISALPAATGQYRTTFDAPGSAAAFLQIRVGLNATTTHAIALSDVVVGPGVVTQGAAISGWNSYTPGFRGDQNAASFTNSTVTGYWRRIGSSMEVHVDVSFTGTPAGGAGAFVIDLPSGYLIDTSVSSSTLQAAVFGTATGYTSSATATYTGSVTTSANDLSPTNGSVVINTATGTASRWNLTTPTTWATGGGLSLQFTVPIAAWAGAGTVNVGVADCQYAFNTNVADATDTTSFGYGQSGQVFPSSTFTAARAKTVRFTTPISSSDILTLEVDPGAVGHWQSIGDSGSAIFGATLVSPYTLQAATSYGIGMTYSSTATDMLVNFGQYSAPNNVGGTAFAAAGFNWSGSTSGKWRVKKCASGVPVGFGAAGAGNAGLLSWYEEGTFSPTITCGTSGVVTYNIQDGAFTRLGKFVNAQLYVSFNKNTCSGSLIVGGLPYAAKNVGNYFSSCATSYIRGFTPPGTYGVANGNTFGNLIAYINPNTTNVTINWPAANTTMTAADASNLNAGSIDELMISCPYNAN